MQNLRSNTRTIVKANYALITEDSYVGSVIPGWKNVDIRIVINPSMGANITQKIIQLHPDSIVNDKTIESQIFFYVIEGNCKIVIGERSATLSEGGYVYIPTGEQYSIIGSNVKLVSFQKKYHKLEEIESPKVIIGNSNDLKNELYLDDPQLLMKYLLPNDISMDFGVNIFTYKPGGNLPFVETHIMEHGLLYLKGEGIYRLNNDWYHVTKGDVIWMGPYCQQWFGALGKEDAVYIYCKDVNRHPMNV